jgi:glycopeptide antibiotics resistance protein
MSSSVTTSRTLEHHVQPSAAFAAVESPTRARLSFVLLLYFLGTILVMTLAPFHFEIPKSYRVLYTGTAFDIFANVMLFIPLGFLYPLTRPSRDEVSPLRVVLVAALISGSIEIIQLFEIDRYTSVIDLITNATGAGLGAVIARLAARRISVNAKLVGRLSLEIPLIGLIYLMMPMLLVASMDAGTDSLRLIAVVPLAFVGARLISAVQRNHFGRSGLLSNGGAGIVAAVWALLGTFPLMLRHPYAGAALVLGAGMTTWWEASRRPLPDGPDRRFEIEALRSAAPHIAAYVLAVILLPLASGVSPSFHFRMALTGANGDIDLQQIQLLVPVATTTVLGYLLAEARGRLEMRFWKITMRVVAECACVAVALEVSRGFQRGVGASGSQLILMLAAAVLGAGIYHNQREHVRWILANRRG